MVNFRECPGWSTFTFFAYVLDEPSLAKERPPYSLLRSKIRR